MISRTDGYQDQGDQGGNPNEQANGNYGYMLPYDDPAIINPDELATFPKQVKTDAYHHHDHEIHHGKKTPVREGRNITRTDNQPDKKGYM